MQHGMHSTFDLFTVERDLRDRTLKYHYLIADERARRPRSHASLIAHLRAVFSSRPQEHEI